MLALVLLHIRGALIALCVLVAASGGCTSQAPSIATAMPSATATGVAPSLVGLWRHGVGLYFDFSADGVWRADESLEQLYIDPFGMGQYEFDGSEFSLVPETPTCHGIKGAYRIEFEGPDRLRMILIGDRCVGRSQALPSGDMTRVDPTSAP